TPLLSPERDVLTPAEKISIVQTKSQLAIARIDAAGQVDVNRALVDKAKLDLDRAERLFKSESGKRKDVDDAQAALVQATKTLEAAEARLRAVESISLEDANAGEQTSLVIESPQVGMIRTQNVAPGEVVSAGAPLFEVMKFDPIWVRVPVYAGETGQL